MAVERNSRKILRRLEQEGWELVRVAGSHHQYRKDGVTLTVPHPKKDLPTGTARAIARSAGWLEEKDT
ncbi:type II toxin-antitoxin system HicA family toxin [Hyphomonas sp.]|uniref:type II toxin-antitoxin system HicA family toxin n=1 Tax=Hyphomonas sp. TaxID=87 RepID=UPI00391ABF2A